MYNIKIECGLRNGEMFYNGYCSDIMGQRIEDEIEMILKDSIIIISDTITINPINSINILFESVKDDVIDDVYKLSIISDTRTISFKVMVSTDQTSIRFPKAYCINLFGTGQKLGTNELVFMINAFFIEKNREEEYANN